MPAFSSTDELTTFSTALTGQYDVEREIGRGGMGVVYLARDLRLDRMVAIKTLPPALASDEAVRERFLREARTVARLNHPNIVPIHRADEINGQVFFVMGFIDGDSLAARIATAPLPPRDALPILRDVAAALGYAHKHGVVHRDVKTENILLDTVTGRSMVTDFGIARVAAAQPMTSTGQVLGTVYYLSPEQVADEGVDARSDIYALGVVGFMMLSGRFPFDGNLASAILVSHVLRPPPPLASVAPHVPASLAAIIDRCLVKDPAGRFQTCEELDAALVRVRPEADAVATVPSRKPSPLLSNTEAQAVLHRAAELDGAPSPIAQRLPLPRDKAADAKRAEGFKTGIIRDAAAEAGINPQFVEQAFIERGLRPVPERDRRATNMVFDMTKPSTWAGGEPDELIYEMVVPGEIDPEDHDLMVSALAHFAERDGLTGNGATVGRALTWFGRTRQHRELQVAMSPREGRTTLRVVERLKNPMSSMYRVIVTPGVSFGLLFCMATVSRAQGQAEAATVGFVAFGLASVVAYIIARTTGDEYSKKRQGRVKELLERLAAQARELAKPPK